MVLNDKVIVHLKFLAARDCPDGDDDDHFNNLFEGDASDIYGAGVEDGRTQLAIQILAMIEVPSDH